MAISWASIFRISLFLLLIAAIVTALCTLPVEKILKDFLEWIKLNLGPWGPLVLALAYIPLTVLAVPASILTLGGGYLFGLPLGFVADSIGATIGATAAFLLGRTIGRHYVISRLKDYPKFQAVAIAIQRSGFKFHCKNIFLGDQTLGARMDIKWRRAKTWTQWVPKLGDDGEHQGIKIEDIDSKESNVIHIVLLLRLVPLLPFNMLNYLLSVTPIGIGEYMLASWLGMMPITLALVYVGTTLKDLSDVTHGWSEVSTSRWVLIISGLLVSAILMVCVTKVAKASLEKALAENPDAESILGVAPQLPVVSGPSSDLRHPLVIKIDSSSDDHSK